MSLWSFSSVPPSPLLDLKSFSFSRHLSPPLDLFLLLSLSLSLLGGGIMWSPGELNTRAEAAAARWIIDGNLGVTRLGLLASLLLHLAAGLTRQNGGREGGRKREGEGEEEESIVWLEDAACLWLQVNYGWKDNAAQISVRIERLLWRSHGQHKTHRGSTLIVGMVNSV